MRIGAILLLVEIMAGSPAVAATVSEGKASYSQNRIADAKRIFAEVIADGSASAEDRSEARRELARIAWLIDANAKSALDHLEAAQSKPCDTAIMTARVLRQSQQAAEAIRTGEALLSSCPEPSRRDEIRTHLIGARLDLAARDQGSRDTLLSDAASETKKFTADADIEAARVRLETVLMTGDAAAALAAWKDYFWVDEGDAPQALEKAGTTAIFNSGLRNGASADDRLRLAELLMRAGFGTQSHRFADAHGLQSKASGNAIMKRLQAYWKAREALQVALLKANRRMAREGKTPAALKSARADLDRADAAWRSTLLAAVKGQGKPDDILRESYGLIGTERGETSGYPSIHRGHLVEDRNMVITQYGKAAKIHYMSVDNMIGNGFESWLWDGGPMVGGWQANGVIVNVRPGYVHSPLRSYDQTRDSQRRRDLIANERKHALEDLDKLKARPVATLLGLSDRLQLQLVDRIATVARTKAADEAGVRRAFLAEYGRANFDQSIVKHEGRHAIDETLGLHGKVEQPVLEYQAKLSELALAAYPRGSLRNMNLNLEGEGPHDKAGAKVFDEYRKWMEVHTDRIMGYDSALPVLAQFDKLSDDQIREIARSLDPLASGKPSPFKL